MVTLSTDSQNYWHKLFDSEGMYRDAIILEDIVTNTEEDIEEYNDE